MKKIYTFSLAFTLATLTVCAGGTGFYDVDDEGVRDAIVDHARAIEARKTYYRMPLAVGSRSYRLDCSGYVLAAYASADVPALEENLVFRKGRNRVAIFYDTLVEYDRVYRRTIPKKGDIIFFDNTYDKNGNGKYDDTLTHAGIVVSVDEAGTVAFLHSTYGRGVVMGYANILYPDTYKKDGVVINSFLRRKRASDPENTSYLAGALVNAYGTVLTIPTDGVAFPRDTSE